MTIYKKYSKEINDKPSFLVGQKAFILNKKGEVLIIQRHQKSTKSELWDFPGGRLDFSESLREGLTRETLEEVGLKITTISVPLSITTFLRDIDTNTQITRIIYLCKASGKVTLSEEHCDFKWINPVNNKKFKLIDEDYYFAFENYLKFKPKNIEFLHKGMLQESIESRKRRVDTSTTNP